MLAIPSNLLAISAAHVAVTLLILFLLVPLLLFLVVRSSLRLRVRSRFRIKIRGRDNVPERGPALLICNRPQYLDWLPLITVLKRPIRFVILAGWCDQPEARRVLHSLNALSLSGDKSSGDALATLQRAGAALGKGELVCVFAESRRFSDDKTLTLDELLDEIRRTCAADFPIVPVVNEHLWGSPHEFRDGGFVKARIARRRPPVWVAFGDPLPRAATASEVVQAVHHCSEQTAKIFCEHLLPVHRELVRTAAYQPFRPGIVDSLRGDTPLSYGKMLAGATCLADVLRPILENEKIIGVWLPSGLGGVFSNVALALLGKTSVNLNYTSAPEANQFAVDQCEIRHVITAKRFVKRMPMHFDDTVQRIYLEDLLPKIGRWARLWAFLKVVLLPGWMLDRWVLGLHRHSLDDTATIIYSSGSTGEPKGVVLTHRNLRANAMSLVSRTGVNVNDRALGTLPFFHSFGYTVTLWMPLQIGALAIYHFDPRQAKEIGDLSRKQRCTVYLSTATFLRFCLRKCPPGDFATTRYIFCGAEKLPPSLAHDFEEKHGVLPLEGYGCTELAPVTSVNLPDLAEGNCTLIRNRIGTVGEPLPGQSARIVHPETRALQPRGEEGVIVMHGGNVMRGYFRRPDITEQVMLEGGYVTGDVGRLDECGHITITGRLSRFAKIGGEMVPVEKVEEELHSVLQTSERVLAVTSVPDQRKGERLVVLHVSLNGTAASSLCEQLMQHGLPNLWIPSVHDFFAVESLPTLGSGKLHLIKLRELAIEITCRG